MDSKHIHRSVFYRYQHVTGPTCVLVSVRFGKVPPTGQTGVRLLSRERTDATIQFDLANHVSEILAGVARANAGSGTHLEVEAIEVVLDDYPGKGQAEDVAHGIALAAGSGVIAP